jgi:hypothetical protein
MERGEITATGNWRCEGDVPLQQLASKSRKNDFTPEKLIFVKGV